MVPYYFYLALLQRIVFHTHKIRRVVYCCRVRTSSLRKGKVFQARGPQQ